MAVALGMLSRLAVGSTQIDFVRSSLGIHDEEIIDGNGLRGTLQHDISRVRTGARRIQGQLSLQPNVAELTAILPWITGSTVAANAYALANAIITNSVNCDFNVGSLHVYDHVAVDTAVFHAEQFGLLGVDLDVVGVDETISGSFSGSMDTASPPWIFSDGVISINSTTVTPKSIRVTIQNHIDRDRFFNSLTLNTTLAKLDRTVLIEAVIPYGPFSALYGAGAAGVAFNFAFTNGNNTDVFTLAGTELSYGRMTPEIEGRVENMLRISGRAYANAAGSATEMTLTLT